MDREKDMTKPTVTFRNFANAPNDDRIRQTRSAGSVPKLVD
jgi:hypothetical protein